MSCYITRTSSFLPGEPVDNENIEHYQNLDAKISYIEAKLEEAITNEQDVMIELRHNNLIQYNDHFILPYKNLEH